MSDTATRINVLAAAVASALTEGQDAAEIRKTLMFVDALRVCLSNTLTARLAESAASSQKASG